MKKVILKIVENNLFFDVFFTISDKFLEDSGSNSFIILQINKVKIKHENQLSNILCI